MHPSADQTGELFFRINASRKFARILDIGGRDVNGTLRPYAPADAEYVSIDISEGLGVDVVLEDPYVYPFKDGYFDCIVSTSCLEHDQMFWLTLVEATRVLAPEGLLYFSAPSQGACHGYPYDNWRFYPDASLALLAWSRKAGRPLRLIESFTHPDMPFNDYVMVFAHADSTIKPAFIHPGIKGAYNIRKLDEIRVSNERLETMSLEYMAAFGQEIQRLRDEVAALKKSAGKTAPAPANAAPSSAPSGPPAAPASAEKRRATATAPAEA